MDYELLVKMQSYYNQLRIHAFWDCPIDEDEKEEYTLNDFLKYLPYYLVGVSLDALVDALVSLYSFSKKHKIVVARRIKK